MDVSWRTLADLGPATGVPLTAALLLLALMGVREAGRAVPGATGAVLVCVLLALAGWRTLRPLAFTDYQSDLERTYRTLRDARETIAFPVPIHEPDEFKIKYYFGENFRIQNVDDRPGVYYLLYPRRARGPRAPLPG